MFHSLCLMVENCGLRPRICGFAICGLEKKNICASTFAVTLVLESISNDLTSNDLVLYIYFQSNALQSCSKLLAMIHFI
jgi:hypothetical protein